jgi:hypothetical protein
VIAFRREHYRLGHGLLAAEIISHGAAGETEPHVLRVVTLEDGEMVHNAFFGRNYREEPR